MSDGCIADFLVAGTAAAGRRRRRRRRRRATFPTADSCIVEDERRDVRPALQLRALSESAGPRRDLHGRLRQRRSTVQRRQDIQLQKFFLPFSGWFLTPKFRYYLYVWSSNASQGDPAQVVGAGNISYVFNRYVTFGGGITSLPERAQHRGPVPVLARRGRSPDRRRVLPRLLHDRRLAQGRVRDEGQVHGDVRQQPEHARRQRGAARQHVRHAVVHAAVAADDRRVRPVGTVRRLRLSREARDAARRSLHVTAPRTSRASPAPTASRTARSA